MAKQRPPEELAERYGFTEDELHYIPDTLCQQCGVTYAQENKSICLQCENEVFEDVTN